MTRSTRTKRWVAVLAAQATLDGGVLRTDQSRMLYATDSGGEDLQPVPVGHLSDDGGDDVPLLADREEALDLLRRDHRAHPLLRLARRAIYQLASQPQIRRLHSPGDAQPNFDVRIHNLGSASSHHASSARVPARCFLVLSDLL